MSAFELPQGLTPLNSYAQRLTTSQLFPISGNVQGTYVGLGNASQTTTFQWRDSEWWIPSMSWFYLDLTITKNGTTPLLTDYVAYADDPAMSLFSLVKSRINDIPVDNLTNPAQISSALSRSTCTKNFNETFNSMSRVGEGFQARLINTCSNGGVVQIAFRPPLSILNARVIPPGSEIKVDFQWIAQGQLSTFFESLVSDVAIGTGAQQFQVFASNFYFYKTTMAPSPTAPMSMGGIIEICPTTCQQYFVYGGNQTKQNFTVPPSTNLILLGLQDSNTVQTNGITPGIGTGWNPITYFSNQFSDLATSTPFSVYMTQAYLQIPEMSITLPNGNPYTFDANMRDWDRAYSDYVAATSNSYSGELGSIPYGSNQTTGGVEISFINTSALASAVMQAGNPYNDDTVRIFNVSGTIALSPAPLGVATTVTPNTFNKKARYGYLGNYPLLSFPIVRPSNKMVSGGNFQLTFSAAVAAVTINVIATYSIALQFSSRGDGMYDCAVVQNA